MKLPVLAIKNNLFILVIVILIILLGVRSAINIPKSEDPFLQLPNFTVIAVYPGTSPTDMEELVADPIEEVIDEIDEIAEVRTEISNGLAVIRIEGEFGIDADDKYDELLAEINNIRSELPSGLYDLEITQFKPEDRATVIQYAIVSESTPYAQMHNVAEELQEDLEKIEMVKNVEIEAYPKEEIRISLDFQKMAGMGISLQQVLGILQGNNRNIPGGEIRAGDLTFNIQSSGAYDELDDFSNTAIKANNGRVVYLRDFAEVDRDYEDTKWRARYNGERCIFVSVNQKRTSNILALSEEMEAVSTQFGETLPSDIKLETAFEQAPAVKTRIDDFIINLVQGVVLVGLIIWIFLGWRAGMIVMTLIPLSILLAILVLDFTGYAIQQISIAALVIALGLLVDNAIVVIENIVGFQKKGYSLLEAAAKGTQEVSYAILSSTLTTVLSFAPLSLLQSGPGEYLRSLPLTVIYALMASLILALTFTPIISSKILKKRSTDVKGTLTIRGIEKLIEKFYRPALNFVLKRGWVPLTGGLLLLVGAISLFPKIGVSFFPTADKNLLLISVDLPYSANIERTDKAVRFVENVLDTTEYVKNYTTNSGHGNPQVYYNRIPENLKQYHGEVVVNFKDWDPQTFYATLDQLRASFNNYPDASITFSELKNGAPFEAPVEILLTGTSLDTLKRLAHDVEKMVANAEGTIDVNNALTFGKTDIEVNINRDKAAIYNTSLSSIDQTVRASLNGIQVDEVTLEEDNETYPVIVRMPITEKLSVNDFEKVYVASNTGHQIPLKQLADIQFKADYALISHFNFDRFTSITANVTDPDRTKQITESIIPALEAYDWPEGYGYYLGGEYETQQSSFGDLGILLVIANIGIFAILVLQFRSLVQPLIIFSAIPLAVTGSFIALFLSGWSFSFFAFVGFISLLGIVVNNSIILVDYTNQLIAAGTEKIAAIRQAAERRFTPILLTTLTTILGLMPLTFSGTSLWSPLGWTLIGGLISSMLLTLLVVPVLYKWFTKVS
ncbi:MAG: efflux RND transporter permease subunit [Bacteroidota bacterium]